MLAGNDIKETECGKDAREVIEIFGAFVVSQMFNQVYDLSCVDYSKDKKNHHDSYERQLLLYVENIKSKAGVTIMIRKLHEYYNSVLKRMDTESAFCRRFALAFVPEYVLTDQHALARVVINSLRSVVIRFVGDVRLEFIDHILMRRSEPGSPRPLQKRFFDLAIMHKQLEHKKIVRLGTSTRSGINNEVVSEMSAQIAQMRSEINTLKDENSRLKNVLILQDKLVKQLQAVKAAAPVWPLPKPVESPSIQSNEQTAVAPWPLPKPVEVPSIQIQEFNEQTARRHLEQIPEEEEDEPELKKPELIRQTAYVEPEIEKPELVRQVTYAEPEPEQIQETPYIEPAAEFDPFEVEQSDVFDL